jgi:hypothetical protein
MGAREDQIARIQQIERIKALEGQPGTAHGVGSAPAPESALDTAKKYAVNALAGFGKVEDSGLGAGTVVRPLAALAGGAIAGKPLFDMSELKDAYNPTNLKRFPDSDTLMARAGVPQGAKLLPEAVRGRYADPGTQHPWYQPEKNGVLDPNLRGTGGFIADVATDPASWLSAGAASVGKQAAAEYAARLSAKPEMTLLQRAAEAAKVAAKNPAAAYFNAAQDVAQLPSKAVAGVGKKIYNSGVEAVEQAGEKLGKKNIGETLYQNGIYGGDRSIKQQADDLIEGISGPNGTRTQLLSQADQAGAQVDLNKALSPYVEKLEQAVKDGRITQDEALKHFDEFAGRFIGVETPNATIGTKIKGDSAERVGNLAYDPARKNTLEQSLGKEATHGIKSEVENSVDDALGSGKGTDDLALQNNELENLIATKKIMTKRADEAAKKPLVTFPDMAFAGGGLELTHSPEGAAYGYAAKRLLDILNSTGVKTTTGYGVRKLGENKATGAMLDDILRQVYKDKTNPNDQGAQ